MLTRLFKNPFLNCSIRWKLLLFVACVCLPTVITAVLAITYFDIKHAKSTLKNDLQVATNMTGDHLSAAIAFDDLERTDETLQTLTHNDAILGACVYSYKLEGQLYAQFQKTKMKEQDCPKNAHDRLDVPSKMIIFSSEIIRKKITIGELRIYATLDAITQLTYTKITLILFCLVGVLLFVSFPLANRLQKNISAPVYQLVEASKQISALSHPVFGEITSTDEIAFSITVLEKLREISRVYFDSIEATETALKNHQNFIDTIDDKIKKCKDVHKALQVKLHNASYRERELVDVAEQTLDVQNELDKEINDLIKESRTLFEDEALIIRQGHRCEVDSKYISKSLTRVFEQKQNLSIPITFIEAKTPWSARVYDEAMYKTLEGMTELFQAIKLSNKDYRIDVEPIFSNGAEIHCTLKCISRDNQILNFDFDNIKANMALLKTKHYSNINNPGQDAVYIRHSDHKIQLIIRV